MLNVIVHSIYLLSFAATGLSPNIQGFFTLIVFLAQ